MNTTNLNKALIETNYGNIEITLDIENTPLTCENFVNYVESGYYDNTLFHRVIDGFMIQGGGLNLDMTDKHSSNAPIKNEADKGAANLVGSVAMARTSDPHSATSQFFINVNDNHFLDYKSKTQDGWGYCVFANVTSGMDTVNKIKNVKTTSKNYHQNVPIDDVIITKISMID